ncbi:hypothetical protein DPMN_176362 [Dreissena polymorpha]|uniref:Uncharacterized protein n=1 Tax=Dreissena polymorpha TaxID=45954 RepID=A0A9D4IJK0_DREPO|nr:hypothetical protein DPMN_176362 [Dreissena polymorpha]
MNNITKGYTRQLGCHQTCQRGTRSTICASEVSWLSSRCTCQVRSRRCFGPSSSCSPIETEAEEKLYRGTQPTPTSHHCYTERHVDTRKVQGHYLRQVPGPKGAVGRRAIEQKW